MDDYHPSFPSFETNEYADRFKLGKKKRSGGGAPTKKRLLAEKQNHLELRGYTGTRSVQFT